MDQLRIYLLLASDALKDGPGLRLELLVPRHTTIQKASPGNIRRTEEVRLANRETKFRHYQLS
jgi:hypothetical protein